jgi:4-amino-4-deoxy-L-arabinose transferase-like glycosyltransferase
LDTSKLSQAKYYGLVFFVALIVYFPGTDRPLRDAEAKYAEIPREMLVLGDWLTPHLNYARYYVKPPITFWSTAILYSVFGVSERVARIAIILWAFLAALLTGVLAQKIFGNGHGYLASGLFLLTTEVYVYCLDAGIEFGLISFMLLAFIFFWDFYRTGSLVYLCLFYLSMGLGFMAKGLPGVVIPGGVAFLFLLFQKERKKLLRVFHPLAVVVFLATVAPWIILMVKRHSEFFEVFILNEHIRRFTGTMESNDALFPTSLWLALVAGEFFPWILYLPQMGICLPKMIRSRAVSWDKILLLLIWVVLPLVLYSTSQSKTDFYGLEIYPPLIIFLSVLVKDLLGARAFSSPRSWAYPWFIVSALAFLTTLFLFFGREMKVVEDLIPSLNVAFVFLIASLSLGLMVALSFLKGKVKSAFLGISVLMVILFYAVRTMYVVVFPYESMKFAADTFSRVAEQGSVLISDERPEFEHVATLNFYTEQQTFLLRDNKGSILYFIEKDREALCLDETDLVKLSRQGLAVYLVGETEKTEKRLSRLKLPLKTLSSSGDRSLFLLESEKSDEGIHKKQDPPK